MVFQDAEDSWDINIWSRALCSADWNRYCHGIEIQDQVMWFKIDGPFNMFRDNQSVILNIKQVIGGIARSKIPKYSTRNIVWKKICGTNTSFPSQPFPQPMPMWSSACCSLAGSLEHAGSPPMQSIFTSVGELEEGPWISESCREPLNFTLNYFLWILLREKSLNLSLNSEWYWQKIPHHKQHFVWFSLNVSFDYFSEFY
jgi:hypothetical protein